MKLREFIVTDSITPELAASILDAALARALAQVSAMESGERLEARYQKWRAMGNVGIAESGTSGKFTVLTSCFSVRVQGSSGNSRDRSRRH